MGRGQELLDAAREGDRRTVERILGQIVTKRSGPFPSLRRGPGVNVQDDNGYTPLHHASLNGHKEIVKLLLTTNCDVPASPCIVDKKGATPLHLAAFKGHTEVVKMLLDYDNPRVNIDQMTTNKETALLIAAHFGYVDVVALLIARGADVTLRNAKMESALDLAAQFGWLETVKHLVRVRPQLVDPFRLPPIGDSRYLSDGVTTPLHRAAKHGKEEVVSALIDAGFDPNIRTDNGTALHEAACFARADVVRLLLSRGARLNARDSRGRTVHDMLNEHSKEATRKVREVIRDFEKNKNKSSYESEEDLPPFPMPHDYSPTVPGYNYFKPSPSFLQRKPACPENKQYEKKVTNANNFVQPTNTTLKIPSTNRYSNNYANADDISKTDSFLWHLTNLGKYNKNIEHRPSEQHIHHYNLIKDIQNLHKVMLSPDNAEKNIEGPKICNTLLRIWPQIDNESNITVPNVSSIGKKKPVPLPKPKLTGDNVLDISVEEKKYNWTPIQPSSSPKPNYSQQIFNWNKSMSIHDTQANNKEINTEPISPPIYQNPTDLNDRQPDYYENMNFNVSDDVKADAPADDSDQTYLFMKPSVTTYSSDARIDSAYCISNKVEVNNKSFTKIANSLIIKDDMAMFMTQTENPEDDTYTQMSPGKHASTAYNIRNIVNHCADEFGISDADLENMHVPARKDSVYVSIRRKSSHGNNRKKLTKKARIYSISSDYVDMKSDVTLSRGLDNVVRVKSIPNCFHFGTDKQCSMHVRGVSGCRFEQTDYQNFYELNHNAVYKNEYPFIKKKVFEKNMPCYCTDLSTHKNEQKCQSQNVYYSCEKVYPEKDYPDYTFVEVFNNPSKIVKIRGDVDENTTIKMLDDAGKNTEDTCTEKEDLNENKCTKTVKILKKKVNHLKQLVIDWQ